MENKHELHPFEISKKRDIARKEFLPLKEGWLKLKSNQKYSKWNQRFFILKEKKLCFYHNENKSKLLGVINFDQVTLDIQVTPQESPTEIIISPLAHNTHFRIKASDWISLKEWARCIYYHLIVSEGYHRDLVQGIPNSPFWKQYRISDHSFRSEVETGDIILFKGRNILCRVQQLMTCSEYDHVAMAIKYVTGKIAFLEATLQNGVAISYWDDFFRYDWFQLYEKIAFRHLTVKRTETMMIKLEEFLENTIGKKYKINLKKIINKFRKHKSGEENNYFCSELIASVYKVMKLLPGNISSSKYWPGNFSELKNLELINGHLGPEQIIDNNI